MSNLTPEDRERRTGLRKGVASSSPTGTTTTRMRNAVLIDITRDGWTYSIPINDLKTAPGGKSEVVFPATVDGFDQLYSADGFETVSKLVTEPEVIKFRLKVVPDNVLRLGRSAPSYPDSELQTRFRLYDDNNDTLLTTITESSPPPSTELDIPWQDSWHSIEDFRLEIDRNGNQYRIARIEYSSNEIPDDGPYIELQSVDLPTLQTNEYGNWSSLDTSVDDATPITDTWYITPVGCEDDGSNGLQQRYVNRYGILNWDGEFFENASGVSVIFDLIDISGSLANENNSTVIETDVSPPVDLTDRGLTTPGLRLELNRNPTNNDVPRLYWIAYSYEVNF